MVVRSVSKRVHSGAISNPRSSFKGRSWTCESGTKIMSDKPSSSTKTTASRTIPQQLY
jgi:hypothetical protein